MSLPPASGHYIEHRIIPKLEIKNGYVVKGLMMEGVQRVGSPVEMAQQYYEDGADELVLLDIVASLYQRQELPGIISELLGSTFSPICAGGGIATLSDAENLFRSGADKVCINTAGVGCPSLFSDLAMRFGSQSVLAQIDVKFYHGEFWVFTSSGRDKSKYLLADWLKIVQDNGVGEVIISSIDKDGLCRGPDLSLIDFAMHKINVPVIYSGGIRSARDVSDCFERGVQACAIAASLHSQQVSIPSIRNELIESGWSVRPSLYAS